MDFKDKAVIVTGGGSGIGRACVEEFAKRNAKVALVDRDAQSSGAVVRKLQNTGTHVEYFQADVSDRKQVEGMIADIASRVGRLDVLVANAGTTIDTVPADLEGVSVEAWDRVFAVNVRGLWLTVRACVPMLRESPVASIVTSCSVAGIRPGPQPLPYAASKGAVANLTKTLAGAPGPAGPAADGSRLGQPVTEASVRRRPSGGRWRGGRRSCHSSPRRLAVRERRHQPVPRR